MECLMFLVISGCIPICLLAVFDTDHKEEDCFPSDFTWHFLSWHKDLADWQFLSSHNGLTWHTYNYVSSYWTVTWLVLVNTHRFDRLDRLTVLVITHRFGRLTVLLITHTNSWLNFLLHNTHWLTESPCAGNTMRDCSLLEQTFLLGFDTFIFFCNLFFLGYSPLLDIKLTLEGVRLSLLWSCIKLNSRVITYDTTTLPSWLVTYNVTSFKHWVSGCTASNVQEPITLILSVVYVLISNLLLGASFIQSASLKSTCRQWQALCWPLSRCLILPSNTGSSCETSVWKLNL